jgi:hypothetical protein
MSTSNNLESKKFISDEESDQGFKNYIKTNNIIIQEKLTKIPYSTDYPCSMNDGKLFAKFSVEYIKNIIFNKKGSKYKENIQFNFFSYVKLFTELEHTKRQKELFEKIINFQSEKADSNNYINCGEFDLIIESIKGEDILNSLSKNKYNFYLYPGKEIKNNEKYCIISEIKLDFFQQIKLDSTQKQFIKYASIIKLLSSTPNLGKIKKEIGLSEINDLIFMLATNGDFFQFDYMRFSKMTYKEDNLTDVDKKYNIPGQLKYIEDISKLNIPVLLLFVPKTLDDNGKIYKNRFVNHMEKEIISLKTEIQNLKKFKGEMNSKMELLEQKIKDLSKEKDEKEKSGNLLDRKRERGEGDNIK